MKKLLSKATTNSIIIVLAWLSVFGLLTYAFNDYLTLQENPNPKPSSHHHGKNIRVQLQANDRHHFLTIGAINSKPVKLLLDTGATDVVIPKALASQLKLKVGAPGLAHTANGTITVYRTTIDNLSIGDIVLHDVSASLNPSMGKKDAILLGMSALKEIDVKLHNGTLTLLQRR